MTPHTQKMFDAYYDAFLINSYLRKSRWHFLLTDGREVIGTPWASSLIDLNNPLFTIKEESGKVYALPFEHIQHAKPLILR